MAAFYFELVSPEKLMFSGMVEQVVVPGAEGEFTMLKDHAPMMSLLRPGIVTVSETNAKSQRLYVRGGFADVSAKGLSILAEEAVAVENLDLVKLDGQIKDAEEDVSDAKTEEAKWSAMEKLQQLRDVRAAVGGV